ncbi:MAG: hypothetical protein FWC41_05810 [Firmicutes bacterium]|nr:hypothetical protein [Bacillota bacterium]
MNIKHSLTAFLIFIAIFLSGFSSNAQNGSDTVTIVKRGAGVNYYYQEGNLLKFNQLMDLTKANEIAYGLMQQAYNLRIASICFYITGGISFGFSLGYFIIGAIFDNIKTSILIPSLGAGVGLLIGGGICGLFANTKILKGVKVFNNSIRQNNNASLDLGFSSNGVMLRLSF